MDIGTTVPTTSQRCGPLWRKRRGERPFRAKPEELAKEMEGTNPSIILDVHTRSQYERDKTQIPGSVRTPPDRIEDWAKRLIAENPHGEPFIRPIATYCT